MGYMGFSLKEESRAYVATAGVVGTSATRFGKEKRGMAHETSLLQFLIFCN
jgi:hypothetical protein